MLVVLGDGKVRKHAKIVLKRFINDSFTQTWARWKWSKLKLSHEIVMWQSSRLVESTKMMDNKMVKESSLNLDLNCTCTYVLQTW